MSRSKRKTPITGMSCSDSDKEDKVIANRRYRKKVKQALVIGEEMPLVREVSDVYCFAKDGKQHIDKDSKFMRK